MAPNGWRAGFFMTLAALVGSLLWGASRGAEPPRSADTTRGDRTPPPAPSAVPVRSLEGPAPVSSCAAELEACRHEGFRVVLDAIQSDVRARRKDAGDAGTAGTGPEAQRRVMDELAREHLRNHWKDRRDEILASVRDVGTPAWIAKQIDETMGKLGPAFTLGGSEQIGLRRGYEALYARHGAVLHRTITASPLDAGALLAALKAFFRDEDALLLAELGADAAERYREMELRSRTAIVGIVAAMGDAPWDDGVLW